MLECLDVVEQPKGSNRGDSIDVWRKMFGFDTPVPWCGIFGGLKSKEGKAYPIVFSARAKDYALIGFSYTISDVIYGNYIPKAGDWRVKGRAGGHHVDTFVSWDTANQKGVIIGGNVNDAVQMREITLRSMIADGTTHIVDVTGFYDWLNNEKDNDEIYETFEGIATFYSDYFDGRRTASGEIYRHEAFTAASKDLAFGTRVRVTNKRNGKSVEVVINDRGPYANNAIIDLSKAAADSIEIRKGKVLVEVLNY
ncbi:MAG: septal ring lytic transglycosylase RlpA family protein [Candidatus Kapabacteria bacterium]|nr:septal ring lytic transglycosylase RlpA family protein [Candidatus Kapabacteria bacterium]